MSATRRCSPRNGRGRSFEHVSNAPDAGGGRQATTLQPPLQLLQSGLPRTARSTRRRPHPWDPPASLKFPTNDRSQVVRVKMLPDPVLQEVADLNQASSARILKGTVWENYMLLATQWPSDHASKTDPLGAPAPTYPREHHARNLQPGPRYRWRRRAAWRATATRPRSMFLRRRRTSPSFWKKRSARTATAALRQRAKDPPRRCDPASPVSSTDASRGSSPMTDLTRRKMLGVAAGSLAGAAAAPVRGATAHRAIPPIVRPVRQLSAA